VVKRILEAEGLGGTWLANIRTSHKILSKDQSRLMWTTNVGIFSPLSLLSSTSTSLRHCWGGASPGIKVSFLYLFFQEEYQQKMPATSHDRFCIMFLFVTLCLKFGPPLLRHLLAAVFGFARPLPGSIRKIAGFKVPGGGTGVTLSTD